MARLKNPTPAAATTKTPTKQPTATRKALHSDSESSSSSESNESVDAIVSTKHVGFEGIFESPIFDDGGSDGSEFSDGSFPYFNGKIIRSFDSF